jgi:hypothetical protein
MTEDEVTAEMRLFALESISCQMWALTFAQLPQGAFEKTRSTWMESARQQTFAGADAATSDLLSAELEIALERLAKMMKSHLKKIGK